MHLLYCLQNPEGTIPPRFSVRSRCSTCQLDCAIDELHPLSLDTWVCKECFMCPVCMEDIGDRDYVDTSEGTMCMACWAGINSPDRIKTTGSFYHAITTNGAIRIIPPRKRFKLETRTWDESQKRDGRPT